MSERIQINETIEIREFTRQENGAEVGTGTFGAYSLGEKEFLKLDGKPIELQKDDVLVLPETHALEKLDLTPKTADGQTADIGRLIVENHGKSIDLSGNNLGVAGEATVTISRFDLAGIRSEGDMVFAVTQPMEIATGGNGIDYGQNQALHITAFQDLGRVDFIDKDGEKLLTLHGRSEEDRGMVHNRLSAMQAEMMGELKTAVGLTDAVQQKEALEKLGVPESDIERLKQADQFISPQQLPHRLPQVATLPEDTKEEKEKRKQALHQMPETEIPDGRQGAVEVAKDESRVTQDNFDTLLAQGIDPQMARAMLASNNERWLQDRGIVSHDGGHHDQNSIQAPEVPGQGNGRSIG